MGAEIILEIKIDGNEKDLNKCHPYCQFLTVANHVVICSAFKTCLTADFSESSVQFIRCDACIKAQVESMRGRIPNICNRLRCEKNGQPIIEDCQDCLIPADGPSPEMFKPSSRDYLERCANCKWYQMARQECLDDNSPTRKNNWCENWEDISGE